jgi:hypothetical protein
MPTSLATVVLLEVDLVVKVVFQRNLAPATQIVIRVTMATFCQEKLAMHMVVRMIVFIGARLACRKHSAEVTQTAAHVTMATSYLGQLVSQLQQRGQCSKGFTNARRVQQGCKFISMTGPQQDSGSIRLRFHLPRIIAQASSTCRYQRRDQDIPSNLAHGYQTHAVILLSV